MAVTVVVTVSSQPATSTTASATSTSHGIPADSIAGIVIGCLLGGVLFIVLVMYLLHRYKRRKYTRAANPTANLASSPEPRYHPTTGSRRSRYMSDRSKNVSMSSEPLIAPESWPRIPSASRVQSPGTLPGSDSFSFVARESQLNETSRVVSSSHSAIPAVLSPSSESLRSGVGNVLSPATSPKTQHTLFIHRMLQSRAMASEAVALSHTPSLDFAPTRSTTVESTRFVDVERLLAEAERSAVRDAEREEAKEDEVEDGADTASVYSQLSAPVEHSASLPRRKSSRRRAVASELRPVAEVPGSPSVDRVSLPLLTSSNFGKASSGTLSGSISSGAGSSGLASRYPSLAPSSVGKSSQSDGGTDWHHLPSGLAGLSRTLRNPHSPVEEEEEGGAGRARLRESTVSSVAEVSRREVTQGGIARIDVSL